MPQPEIKPIDTSTLDAVAALLGERNRTLAAYVAWKYLDGQPTRNHGVVAFIDGQPAGCFGLMPRLLQLPDGAQLPVGWFADWYVAPAFRASGLGRTLLAAITQAHPLTLGHPGTPAAQRLCATLGYLPLPFQARRRLILKPLLYEKLRTKVALKAVFQLFKHQAQASWQRLTAAKLKTAAQTHAALAVTPAYHDWMCQQPVRPQIRRSYQSWEADGLRVVFCDDQLPSGETRRRILFTHGSAKDEPGQWRAFVTAARQAGCCYLELFTTDRALCAVWQSLGALPYPDAPVVCHGPLPATLQLHGWDRENWTFLADQPPAATTPHTSALTALKTAL